MRVDFRSSENFNKLTFEWAKKAKINADKLREAIAAVADFDSKDSYKKFLDRDLTKDFFVEGLVCNLSDYENSKVFERSITIKASKRINDFSVIKSIPPQIQCLNHPKNEALVLISEVLNCDLNAIKKLDIDKHLHDGEALSELEACSWPELYEGINTDENGYAVEVLDFYKTAGKFHIAFNLDVTANHSLSNYVDFDAVLQHVITKNNFRLDEYQLYEFISNYVTEFLSSNPDAFFEDPNRGYFFKEALELEFKELFFNEMIPNMPIRDLQKLPLINWGSELSHEVANLYHLTNSLIHHIATHQANPINNLLNFLEDIDCLPNDQWGGEHIMF